MIARPGGVRWHRRLPAVLDGTAVPSPPPGLARAHATLNELTVSALSLTVSGPGDDHQALALRARVENLVRCGVRQVSLDARGLSGASDLFVRVLADLVTSAGSQGCVVSVVGLDAAGVLDALYRAPLDQLRVVHGARSGPSRPAVAVGRRP